MSRAPLTERHLRRLRWELTLLYGAAMALALAVLGFVVVQVDSDLRESDLQTTLLEKAQQAASAVAFDDAGAVDTSRFGEDSELTEGWPQAYLYVAGAGGPRSLASPAEDWYGVELAEVAEVVLTEEPAWLQWVATLETGSDVVARGLALRAPGAEEPVVAAIAVVDEADFFADQGALVQRIAAMAAVLVLVACAAGYWVAGRATRATAGVLERQEQLLTDAAHELRTPIARIRAVSEGGVAGDEPPPAALARVAALSADAGSMVDDMLFLARVDAGDAEITREPLRLDLLAEEVVSHHEGVTLEAVETVVEGDAGLLRRAIDNLVRNAVSHGQGRGVKVTVYPKVVLVADEGPGLDSSLEGEAMARFRKGPASQGHGLGLAIVRWVVDAHGGRVTVSDRQEAGVEARISLD